MQPANPCATSWSTGTKTHPHPALPLRGREKYLLARFAETPSRPSPQGGGRDEALLDLGRTGRRLLFAQDRLDILTGLGHHLADAASLVSVGPALARLLSEHPAKVAHLVAQVVHHPMDLTAELRVPAVAHPVPDLVDHWLALGQESPAGLGHGIDLLAVLLDDRHVSHVLQKLERGIDGARAGGVEAAKAVLQRPDQL